MTIPSVASMPVKPPVQRAVHFNGGKPPFSGGPPGSWFEDNEDDAFQGNPFTTRQRNTSDPAEAEPGKGKKTLRKRLVQLTGGLMIGVLGVFGVDAAIGALNPDISAETKQRQNAALKTLKQQTQAVFTPQVVSLLLDGDIQFLQANGGSRRDIEKLQAQQRNLPATTQETIDQINQDIERRFSETGDLSPTDSTALTWALIADPDRARFGVLSERLGSASDDELFYPAMEAYGTALRQNSSQPNIAASAFYDPQGTQQGNGLSNAQAARKFVTRFNTSRNLLQTVLSATDRSTTGNTQPQAQPREQTENPSPQGSNAQRPESNRAPHRPDSQQGAQPAGSAMPVGDLPGWKQVFTENFDTDVPVGGFPGSVYQNRWSVEGYEDGTPDTDVPGQRVVGKYYPSRVVSVSNGTLKKYVHTENGVPMAAAILPVLPEEYANQPYGRYSIRFRADAVQGFKTAWLLWPQGQGGAAINVPIKGGEIDFPEGDLDREIMAFAHSAIPAGMSESEADERLGRGHAQTGTTYQDWHVATIEWTPDKIKFILDDREVGTVETGTSEGKQIVVPSQPMQWVIQTETSTTGEGDEPSDPPPADAAGNVEIDWATVYKPQ